MLVAPSLAIDTMLDSQIFQDQYGTPEMRSVFSDRALVEKWAGAEAALARAQATAGVIPGAAAEEISDASTRTGALRFEPMRVRLAATAHPLMPFLMSFDEIVGDEGSKYLHWGATTQDIMDTAVVLQMRDALQLITSHVDRFIRVLTSLAEVHATTPMAGRTHGQHAVPITFGLKMVNLATEMARHRERLRDAEDRLLVAQLGGAAGSLAAMGDKALEIRRLFCLELGLQEPTSSWHSARDRFAEYVFLLSIIAMTVGRAALEVIELQRTEIGELAEPSTPSSVGSSTMPQKLNPMISEVVLALARLQKPQMLRALDGMIQAHERDMSTWHTEWTCVAESSIVLSGALKQIEDVYGGLDVRTERMLLNLEASGDKIYAEAVMMELAVHLGRTRAHEVVSAVSRTSEEAGTPFIDELCSDPQVASALSRTEIESLMSYEGPARHSAVLVRAAIQQISASEGYA
jgi:3-carboxy-cis,cis-muconate cycloisomerase